MSNLANTSSNVSSGLQFPSSPRNTSLRQDAPRSAALSSFSEESPYPWLERDDLEAMPHHRLRRYAQAFNIDLSLSRHEMLDRVFAGRQRVPPIYRDGPFRRPLSAPRSNEGSAPRHLDATEPQQGGPSSRPAVARAHEGGVSSPLSPRPRSARPFASGPLPPHFNPADPFPMSDPTRPTARVDGGVRVPLTDISTIVPPVPVLPDAEWAEDSTEAHTTVRNETPPFPDFVYPPPRPFRLDDPRWLEKMLAECRRQGEHTQSQVDDAVIDLEQLKNAAWVLKAEHAREKERMRDVLSVFNALFAAEGIPSSTQQPRVSRGRPKRSRAQDADDEADVEPRRSKRRRSSRPSLSTRVGNRKSDEDDLETSPSPDQRVRHGARPSAGSARSPQPDDATHQAPKVPPQAPPHPAPVLPAPAPPAPLTSMPLESMFPEYAISQMPPSTPVTPLLEVPLQRQSNRIGYLRREGALYGAQQFQARAEADREARKLREARDLREADDARLLAEERQLREREVLADLERIRELDAATDRDDASAVSDEEIVRSPMDSEVRAAGGQRDMRREVVFSAARTSKAADVEWAVWRMEWAEERRRERAAAWTMRWADFVEAVAQDPSTAEAHVPARDPEFDTADYGVAPDRIARFVARVGPEEARRVAERMRDAADAGMARGTIGPESAEESWQTEGGPPYGEIAQLGWSTRESETAHAPDLSYGLKSLEMWNPW